MRAVAIALTLAACGRVDFAPRTVDGGGEGGGQDGGADASDGASALEPTHRYRLAGNYDDDFGGPPLVGGGGTFTPAGYAFGANQGLTLDFVLGDAYTIDLDFQLADVTGGWRKLVDYSGLVKDEGLYIYEGAMQFVIASGADFETTRSVLSSSTTIRMTITRSAAGDVTGYVARLPQPAIRNTIPDPPSGTTPGSKFAFADTDHVAAPSGTTSVAFFIDDTGTGQAEASSGTARQIAIWDHPLTISEIAALP